MSLAGDFLNFGTTAVSLAATTGIVKEEIKLLRNAQRQVKPRREHMASHSKHHTKQHHSKTEQRNAYGGKSSKSGWALDFRL